MPPPDQNQFSSQLPSQFTMPPPPPAGGGSLKLIIGSIIFIVFVAAAVGVFFYMQKTGVLGRSGNYTEEDFFSGLLTQVAQIKSSTYSASGTFSIGERDAGAEPFTIEVSNEAEIRQQYQDDYTRGQNISTLLSMLQSYYGTPRYATSQNPTRAFKPYPASLTKLIADQKNSSYAKTSIKDPVTGKPYEYKVTNNGKNFALSVTFETGNAVTSVKRYDQNATSTTVSGKKVTFTKDSYSYFYLPREPRKPMLVELGESLRMLPPDISASAAVKASSEWKIGTMADWTFNFDAQGSFGDLSYKVNADALKKDKDYYFKINNIPSLFIGSIANFKGKWIKVSPDGSTTTDRYYGGGLEDLASELPEFEEEYKKNRELFVNFLKKAVAIADEVKVIEFKDNPKSETVDGQKLTRYNISLRKEGILAFYTKLEEAVTNDASLKDFREIFSDPGVKDYLQSDEFNQVFDYFNENTKVVMWVDSQGFPAHIEYSLRIVPPDTAVQLADKQINLVFKLSLADINQPLNIKAPAGAITLEEATKQVKNNSNSGNSALAKVKANLNSLRAQAELVYDDTPGRGYGTKAFPLGACKQTTGTLFGNKDVYKYITEAAGTASKATCASKLSAGKVNSWAVSVPLPSDAAYSWCVDSTGVSQQIKGKIKTSSCN